MANNTILVHLRRKISELENQLEDCEFYDYPASVVEPLYDKKEYYENLLQKYEKQ